MPKNVGERRPSGHIREPVAQSAFRAFDFAKATERRLNTYAVIILSSRPSLAPTTAFTRILHKFRVWLANRTRTLGQSCPPIYVYAHESPGGHSHVNWVLHVPDDLQAEFQRKLEGWVRKVLGEVRPYDVKVKPVVSEYDKHLAKYILKGTDERYIAHFHLQAVYKGQQGEVWGQRAGVSRAIGSAARKRAKFHPGRNRPYRPAGVAGRETKHPTLDRVEAPVGDLRDAFADAVNLRHGSKQLS